MGKVTAIAQRDGRNVGEILRDSKGKFITRQQWLQNANQEIQEYFRKIKHYEKFVGENPDLQVLIDAEKAKIAAKESEMRLVNFSRRGINDRVKIYKKAMEQQGMKGKQLEEQVARYREGLLADRTKHFNKLKGQNAAKKAASQAKTEVKKPGFFKQVGNFFSNIGKSLKANKGKVAIGVGILAAVGSAIYMATRSDNNVPNEPLENDNSDNLGAIIPSNNDLENSDDVLTDSVAAEQSDSIHAPTSMDLQPGDKINLPDGSIHIVQDGESIWSIGKKYLKEKNKDTAGYEPSGSELCKQRDKLMELNKLTYNNKKDRKDYYVDIYPGDTIQLAK